jgi:hypothetical protein
LSADVRTPETAALINALRQAAPDRTGDGVPLDLALLATVVQLTAAVRSIASATGLQVAMADLDQMPLDAVPVSYKEIARYGADIAITATNEALATVNHYLNTLSAAVAELRATSGQRAEVIEVQPIVNITVPSAPVPDVIVNVPDTPTTLKVFRDSQGRISEVVKEVDE